MKIYRKLQVDFNSVYVVSPGMEEDPEMTLDIHCLRRGGGAALTSTNNYFLHRRGSGSAWAITV